MVWAPEQFFDRHLPLLLLTGFLGSGKTTLLNRLLRDPRLANSAVVVNEFGSIPVDHSLIEAPAGTVAALPNGCMCCLATDDLYLALDQMFAAAAARGAAPFRRVIIETSGLADPEAVLRSVTDNPVLNRFLWLDRIVTVIDAQYGADQIATHPEAMQQVRLADRLVLSKTDLAPAAEARLRLTLHSLNPMAGIVETAAPAADLLTPAFLDPDGAGPSLLGAWAAGQLRDLPSAAACNCGAGAGCGHRLPARHGPAAQVVVLDSPQPVEWRAFHLWLTAQQHRLGSDLLRVKGLVEIAGDPRPLVIHAVRTTLHVPVALAAWPEGQRDTRLVFILTDRASTADLEAAWQAFLRVSIPG